MKKENCKKGLILKFLLAIALCCLPLEVNASTAPTIVDISVEALSDGIRAKCSFTGYDRNADYELQLYLVKVTATGEEHITYVDMQQTDSGEGSSEEASQQVETGVYKASVVFRATTEEGQVVINVKDSILYDVTKTEDGYEIIEHDPGEKVASSSGSKVIVSEGGNSCIHEFEYMVCEVATPDKDTLLAQQCLNCGDVLDYIEVANSAYQAFLQETCRQIEDAEQNTQVVIKTNRWISFNQSVSTAIMSRPDVEVKVEYLYKGDEYRVTIPAETDVIQLLDENGYCGFLYLAQVFGSEELTE